MVTPVTKMSDCNLNISVFLFNMFYRVFSYNAAKIIGVPMLYVCASHCNCQSGGIVCGIYNIAAV
jgi:hypothetical protein